MSAAAASSVWGGGNPCEAPCIRRSASTTPHSGRAWAKWRAIVPQFRPAPNAPWRITNHRCGAPALEATSSWLKTGPITCGTIVGQAGVCSLMRRVGRMHPVTGVVGVGVIGVILWDTFETVVLPRRVARRLRPARLLFRTLWRVLVSGAAAGAPPRPGGGVLRVFCFVFFFALV